MKIPQLSFLLLFTLARKWTFFLGGYISSVFILCGATNLIRSWLFLLFVQTILQSQHTLFVPKKTHLAGRGANWCPFCLPARTTMPHLLVMVASYVDDAIAVPHQKAFLGLGVNSLDLFVTGMKTMATADATIHKVVSRSLRSMHQNVRMLVDTLTFWRSSTNSGECW